MRSCSGPVDGDVDATFAAMIEPESKSSRCEQPAIATSSNCSQECFYNAVAARFLPESNEMRVRLSERRSERF
jgi:hypothetical protein